MLNNQIVRTGYPVVHLGDKASVVLGLMEDYEVQHLPIIDDAEYLGLISKEDLLDADEMSSVAALQEGFLKVSVKADDYFLSALKQINEHQLSLIPVLSDKGELTGIINLTDLLSAINNFLGGDEPGGIIVLDIERRQYSFGEICKLIETNDAMIMQLNTSVQSDTGNILATIKINKTEISDIIATFQRYDYNVKYYFGEEHFTNELKDNYQHLMNYLNI